jgi:hypothetical protein
MSKIYIFDRSFIFKFLLKVCFDYFLNIFLSIKNTFQVAISNEILLIFCQDLLY